MRPYLAIGIFVLAVVVAACGGGGTSSTLPAPKTAPTPMQMTRAAFTLKIPPQASTGSQVRRPAYVSPNTKSVAVIVVPQTSATPMPAQIFPIATPSPCAPAAGGGESCTFNVQVPYGTMSLQVATYAVPNPGPSSVPLSTFETGTFTVAAGSTPPPLSFTLTGVVGSVSVAMQNPDPSITPSTQIATVGTAITSSALSITPRDASGSPIITDTFEQPVTVSVSPANAGVSLVLAGASQCKPASSASGTSASITCASDLNKLAFAYDGTIARDASGNVIDHVAFEASPQANGSPKPAYLALAGAMLPSTLPAGGVTNPSVMRFVKNPDGRTFTYMIQGFAAGTTVGSFDPANPSAATAVNLPVEALGMTVDGSGNIWIPDYTDTQGIPQYALTCYQGVTQTATSSVQLETPGSPAPVQPYVVTTDTSGNVWFYGTDGGGNGWAGFIPPGSCSSSGPSFASASVQIGASFSSAPQDIQPQKGGGVFLLDYYTGLYAATTSSNGAPGPVASPSGYGQSVSVDSSGNAYVGNGAEAGFPNIALYPVNGNSYTTTLTITDGSTPNYVSVNPQASPSTFAYTEYTAGNIGFGSVPSLSHVALINVGGTCYATLFDTNSEPWGACWNGTTSVMQLEHFVPTSVWTAMFPSNPQVFGGETLQVGVLEKGYSGPFTVTVSDPTAASVASPAPGFEHTIPITFTAAASSGSFSLTVTDANGRSQTLPVNWALGPLARRHFVKHVRKKP